jgi:hypothetical protein
VGYPQLPQRPIPPVHHVTWLVLPRELVPPDAMAFLHQHAMIPA